MQNPTVTIDASGFVGARDRSWGFRPHPSADDPKRSLRTRERLRTPLRRAVLSPLFELLPASSAPQFFWTWIPMNFVSSGGSVLLPPPPQLRRGLLGAMYHRQ